VDISNMALNQLKAKNILSLEENTEEAYQARRMYDVARRALLRKLPWGFARRIKPLAPLADRVQGTLWREFYAYPDDCLMVRRLFGEGGEGGYEVFSLSSAVSVLATDVAGAYLDYTYDLRDTGRFPPDFALCLSYFLAFLLAPALSADESAETRCHALYQAALGEAARAGFNEAREVLAADSDILRARW
jgi:hypothetical protein